jgi:Na+-driven multidrug efflux pump
MMILFAVSSAAWMIFGRNFIKGDEADVYQLSVRYLLGTVFGVVLLSLGSAAAGVPPCGCAVS